jgi:hypothetical protein
LTQPCFGVQALGLCAYDPAQPFATYFSLGDVVAALAFTLAVHQLLKPVYVFRLGQRYLTPARLYSCVFTGAAAVLVATLLPNIPWLHGGFWGYALSWEILGAFLFATPYAAVVWAIVRPVRVRPARIPDFARGAASLLSLAEEQDHIDFVRDLERSLPTLIRAAAFGERFDHRETSAFFDFTHRDALERAAWASSFLLIVADPAFCATLVRRCPWQAVSMLRTISAERLHATAAEQLVREIAGQAILRDDSMMAREMDYHGFGMAPLLSESLFSDAFVLKYYNPFATLFFSGPSAITASVVQRFNRAAKLCYATLIEKHEIVYSSAAHSVAQFYESVFMRAPDFQTERIQDSRLADEMDQAVALAIEAADKLLASLSPGQYRALYVQDPECYRHDVLETLVGTVYGALARIANHFKGFDDAFWTTAVTVFQRAIPRIGGQPDGMTPFQQRLALKLIDQLKDNMEHGWYPAISRVLLACVGPYKDKPAQRNRTAFNILKDATYYELHAWLKRFDMVKIKDFLPDNVSYDKQTNTLAHSYRDGVTRATSLSELAIAPVSLIDEGIFG